MGKNNLVYYNEIDPKAAAWLRELIKNNLIADGIVDERSIEDVKPSELGRFKQCHFFAGIGVWSYSLRSAGIPDDFEVWTGSCPCQPFSTAGKGEGFEDERHLWPSFHWLIKECRPGLVFGEQVAGKSGEAWLDLVSTDLEGEGYAIGSAVTAACGFGAPHQRKRLYWVAHSNGPRLEGTGREGIQNGHSEGRSECSDHGILADTEGDGHKGGREEGGGTHEGSEEGRVLESEGEGTFNELADTERSGGRARGESECLDRGLCGEGKDNSLQITERSSSSDMADPDRGRCEQRDSESEEISGTVLSGSHGKDSESGGGLGESSELEPSTDGGFRDSPDSTNGFWRDVDWLRCRDGKWRCVEPGTFPLVDGAAERVGRLRGYGNAIVAPQAKEFIESYFGI